MRALIRDCWAQDPAQRPPMAKVIERLAAMEHQFRCVPSVEVGPKRANEQNNNQLRDIIKFKSVKLF
jgi:hypothetical protein